MNQLITKHNVLCHRIERWRDIQDVYMPTVTQYRAESISPDDNNNFFMHPKTIPLHLPSTLPMDICSTVSPNLIEIDKRLRLSQADDSLHDLQSFLRITMGLWDYKRSNVGSSQRSSTRMYSTIGTYREKVNRCSNRYRAAYCALSTLDPGGLWTTHLQELKAADVRPPICDMEKVPKAKAAR